jgi:hypothetical protein
VPISKKKIIAGGDDFRGRRASDVQPRIYTRNGSMLAKTEQQQQ